MTRIRKRDLERMGLYAQIDYHAGRALFWSKVSMVFACIAAGALVVRVVLMLAY